MLTSFFFKSLLHPVPSFHLPLCDNVLLAKINSVFMLTVRDYTTKNKFKESYNWFLYHMQMNENHCMPEKPSTTTCQEIVPYIQKLSEKNATYTCVNMYRYVCVYS